VELANILKISLPEEFYIFTFHPETNSADYGQELLKSFLNQLQNRLDLAPAKVIFTGVNNDHGSSQIKKILESFCQLNSEKAHYFESLGVLNYLSMVRHSAAVLGNSSSGVLEAHSLKTPAVNLGSRQAGREREESLIDLVNLEQVQKFNFENVVNSKKLLLAQSNSSIFGNGKTSEKITNYLVTKVLPTLSLNEGKSKVFFDLPS
jgi:GDP/UDP-N,N'-diacetylbacillosamine 2-epimerase (hydrolysing)